MPKAFTSYVQFGGDSAFFDNVDDFCFVIFNNFLTCAGLSVHEAGKKFVSPSLYFLYTCLLEIVMEFNLDNSFLLQYHTFTPPGKLSASVHPYA